MVLIGAKDLHLFLLATAQNAGPSARQNPSVLRMTFKGGNGFMCRFLLLRYFPRVSEYKWTGVRSSP
jgi:hypothetical protein